MSTSALATSSFWRDLLERAGRQAAQTALPIVVAVSAAGGLNLKAVAVAIAGAVVLTVVKALATVNVTPGETWYWVLLDRAVPAAAGTVLGMWPVDAFDIDKVDWSAVGWAAASAAVVALLAYYVTPPATSSVSNSSRMDSLSEDNDPLGPHEVL